MVFFVCLFYDLYCFFCFFFGRSRFCSIVGVVLVVLYCAYSCLNFFGVIFRWLAAHFTVTFPAACFSRPHLSSPLFLTLTIH